jgi:hypothetical protein
MSVIQKTHFADDATVEHIAKLEREAADLRERLAKARTIAWDWGQGVTDAETAIRLLHKMFPIGKGKP